MLVFFWFSLAFLFPPFRSLALRARCCYFLLFAALGVLGLGALWLPPATRFGVFLRSPLRFRAPLAFAFLWFPALGALNLGAVGPPSLTQGFFPLLPHPLHSLV